MTKRLPPMLASLLVLTGCVTTGKFQAESQRADNAEAKLAGAKKQIDSQKGEIEASQKLADDLRAQIASLQKSNKDLEGSLNSNRDALSKKVSDLIKEKDGLSADLAGLRTQLAKTESDKKALEAAKAAELAQVKKSYEDLTAGLKSEIAAGEVTITQLKGKLTLNMVDRILFDSGQAEVRGAGKKVLDRIATVLNGVKDKDIRIEGHTDNVGIAGKLKDRYPSNWELSTARATAVARYLQDRADVDARRLVAAGYGEFRPVSPNDTPEHRALNRRIEIVLVPRE